MKKVVVFSMLLFAAAANAQTEISAKYDHIGRFHNGVAVVELAYKKGLINVDGKELIKPEWETLSGFGADGIGYCRKNNLVGLIKIDGTILVEPSYQRIGDFKNGRAVTVKNGLKGLIDINGKVIIEPKYQHLSIEEGGLVRAKVGDKEELLKIEK